MIAQKTFVHGWGHITMPPGDNQSDQATEWRLPAAVGCHSTVLVKTANEEFGDKQGTITIPDCSLSFPERVVSTVKSQ